MARAAAAALRAHAEPRDGVVVSSYVIDVEAEEEEGGGDEPTGRSRTRRGRLVGGSIC